MKDSNPVVQKKCECCSEEQLSDCGNVLKHWSALPLVGTELTSFTVAGTVLFQICDRAVLIAHPCVQLMLSNDYAAPGSFLTLLHGWPHWGQARKGGDAAGTADLQWLKGYPTPCGIMLLGKSWGKRKERRIFGVMEFVFPNNCYEWWIPSFLATVKHLWVVVNEFPILLCLRAQLFLYLLNCLYLDTPFLALLPFWFSAHPTRQGEAGVWGSKQWIVWGLATSQA